jgi:hypothetical protein
MGKERKIPCKNGRTLESFVQERKSSGSEWAKDETFHARMEELIEETASIHIFETAATSSNVGARAMVCNFRVPV